MDFPAWEAEPAEAPEGLAEALGATPAEVHCARDWICVFETPEQVIALAAPDHAKIAALAGERVIATAANAATDGCVIATAKGWRRRRRHLALLRRQGRHSGRPGDRRGAHPARAVLVQAPSARDKLVCRQASARGGLLWTEYTEDRVRIAGHAVAYARGEITL